MSRTGWKQVAVLLLCGGILVSLAAPVSALDCVKKTVNRTGQPQREQLVVLDGIALVQELLLGRPFMRGQQLFSPAFITPLRFFDAPGGAVPSTQDLNPPVESVCTTGFSILDHEFRLLSWTWNADPNHPTAVIADPSPRFQVISTAPPVIRVTLCNNSDLQLDGSHWRILAFDGRLPLSALCLDPVSPDGRTKSAEELAEESEDRRGDGEGNGNGNGEEVGALEHEPPMRPPRKHREIASDEPQDCGERVLLQIGDICMPPGTCLQFDVPAPPDIPLQDLTVIARGTVFYNEYPEATAQVAFADQVGRTYPPALGRPFAFPSGVHAGEGFVDACVCVVAIDTDRDRDPNAPLPEIVDAKVTARDSLFDPGDVSFDLRNVTAESFTVGDRRHVQLCLPIRLRRETPNPFMRRFYDIMVTVRDPDGTQTIQFNPIQIFPLGPGVLAGPR